MSEKQLKIKTGLVSEVVFRSGGMEVLFDYKRAHQVQIPKKTSSNADVDIRYLIHWLVENLLTDKTRTDLFAQGESVLVFAYPSSYHSRANVLLMLFSLCLVYVSRPGILVLVNDTDWELEGELDYKIQPRDSIMFISSRPHSPNAFS